MNKGIEYIIEQDAIDLCTQLDPLKNDGDDVYSKPIKKYDENKWFVQILNKDVHTLQMSQMILLVDFPLNYFDPNSI